MKKHLSIVLTVVMLMLLLIGCGANEKINPSADSNEIIVAASGGEKAAKPAPPKKPDNEPFNDPQRNPYDGGP